VKDTARCPSVSSSQPSLIPSLYDVYAPSRAANRSACTQTDATAISPFRTERDVCANKRDLIVGVGLALESQAICATTHSKLL